MQASQNELRHPSFRSTGCASMTITKLRYSLSVEKRRIRPLTGKRLTKPTLTGQTLGHPNSAFCWFTSFPTCALLAQENRGRSGGVDVLRDQLDQVFGPVDSNQKPFPYLLILFRCVRITFAALFLLLFYSNIFSTLFSQITVIICFGPLVPVHLVFWRLAIFIVESCLGQ